MNSIYGSVMIWAVFIVWLTPSVLVLKSNKTTGREKLAWVLTILFVSWFAWVIYMVIAPIKPKVDG
ncbi:hypothetical protein A8140_08300 [Vibrio campbellii CAIM 519 = NBRC 15631 = ATCC 25920]|uniref:hypothetical protein n=1 Tax=Vibrio campbellii TaxID=680 RepID=UPI0002AE4EEC|nr:hypothetical protein [Vibrio campbellii]ARV72722.1 hypothetical protein A8140_08300 [Vibrio campbellii CAIM 519 = NBRC 15631 = ATCC 25920]ELU49395.1 hypothetical protein B878_23563 [Vibrio campbellii CAIM 519 = NBRC 15631 = ATCC 25920]